MISCSTIVPLRWRYTAVMALGGLLLLSGCRRPNASESPPGDSKTGAASVPVVSADEAQPTAPAARAESGQQLYARHCAACHGPQGDGQGMAAAFLFPKPRDLRAGRFRFVSTNNNVPTREDLLGVLVRGMPGSAMPSWAQLSEEEREALVDEIFRLRHEGAKDIYVQSLKEDEGLTDEEIAADDVQQEIEDYADEFTTPGESTEVPAIGASTPEAVARGQQVYKQFVCISCHGETGRGDGVQEMFDDEKLPTQPRDFTLGIFKGNHDPQSLYRRIAYGMPGTPMPSSSNMTADQMVDLVHYIRSLSTEEQREAAVLKREKIVAKRLDAVPNSEQDEAWSGVEPVQLRMTPLWWRTDTNPNLEVQAVHDGKKLAVRLSWDDTTADEHAVRSEAFEDAVAMELYRGTAEPFLGMGSADAPIDVWFWDADRQRGLDAPEKSYPNAVVDVYPFSETVAEGTELNRAGARMANQPDVSLPARASGNQIVPTDDESGGTSLHVGGPGSVTFRVPQSQIVDAHGTWDQGRWTVVLTRRLAVEPTNEGVSLAPGDRASVAFAVWDGAHRDRDGQKLITIWQDLELE